MMQYYFRCAVKVGLSSIYYISIISQQTRCAVDCLNLRLRGKRCRVLCAEANSQSYIQDLKYNLKKSMNQSEGRISVLRHFLKLKFIKTVLK